MRKHQVFWFPIFFCSVAFFDTEEASRIPLGSKLSVAEHDYWISPNGNFAFGFFNHSDQPNRFGVGVRFNSRSIPLPERTLVWVAGAHVSVGYDSFLQLNEAGDLVLFDSSEGATVWRSNTHNSSVAWASLGDDGNLVLSNARRDVVWQSFGTPSDTLLPGQNLTSSQTLRAASSNFVSSYYGLSMDASGQLRLSWETNVTYWKTEATSSEPILAAVFTGEGAFQLLDVRLRPVWSRFGDDHNDSSASFRFLKLDSDGNLRMYSWSSPSNSWKKAWQAVENQCDVFATCGLSGICAFTPSGDTICKCPFGGSSSSSNSNCLAPDIQACDARSTMIALNHTFLYGIYPPEDFITRSSIELCRNSCSQDPHCTSVTVTNDGKAQCRMKRTRFVTGHEHPSLTSISFVKVCFVPFPAVPGEVRASSPSLLRRSSRLHVSSAVLPASGALAAFLALQVGAFLYFLRRRKAIKSSGAARFPCRSSVGLISLSYSELKDITSNFKHQLGLNLHKGVLPIGRAAAVEELKYDTECGEDIGEKQFKSWISVLGGTHHKNLVRLLAYSCNSGRRFLVYEFIKNASVDKWLEDAKLSRRLTWRKRMDICIGVARALAYLHSGCREFVSHGNLNWENVLLNEELEAKVTGFGLARVRGNAGQNSQGAEVDVARFGEMIVTMVSGHRGGGGDVCGWAYKEWAEGRAAARVVDSRIAGKFDLEEVERMLRVAFWCIQTDARLRPMMAEVLKVLEGMLSVDPPPPPYPCLKSLEESHSIQ
ncbi:G-type lectin S-receptor-like serine/threonine-protein kinase SD3-1 isoform X1 [Phoenix dactylifera]|uniref:Receptor-like serine/threonine-protein kinase n=1 Tax=Phoenix dactylifera TaxID=42345 RepID=A0A8B8J2U0_PHODC|nr:G-type lectin S-receptor-like serine/threonine-protein kinase SD3-1 isoform X1 [Phoenix dactylifera]